ncbi:hypothetical protein NDN08_004913 [Rhodosorus marinus]|uniref:Protein-tyrosine sulfotransferase n=1 Tax=Rhodosorus marinus TaxID=101924 RepID=A0AAV8UIB4_9RHOD|nr:hypothetical protein NDN08_004913 [Rhodosorus marinus]
MSKAGSRDPFRMRKSPGSWLTHRIVIFSGVVTVLFGFYGLTSLRQDLESSSLGQDEQFLGKKLVEVPEVPGSGQGPTVSAGSASEEELMESLMDKYAISTEGGQKQPGAGPPLQPPQQAPVPPPPAVPLSAPDTQVPAPPAVPVPTADGQVPAPPAQQQVPQPPAQGDPANPYFRSVEVPPAGAAGGQPPPPPAVPAAVEQNPPSDPNPLSDLDLYIPEGPNEMFGKTISFSPMEKWDAIPINVADYDLSKLSQQLPECATTVSPPKTFIFIMSSHTGSTAMMSQLLRHPDLHWLHGGGTMELLNRPGILGDDEAEVRFTRGFMSDCVKVGKVGGFKMNPTPIKRNPEPWKQIAADFETGVIWNYRENMLKRSVGRFPPCFLDDDVSVAGVQAGMSREERCKQGVGCTFKVDAEKLHSLMVRSKILYDDMHQAVKELTVNAGRPACVLNVPYEDYLYHPTETILQMEKFLGLKPYITETWRAKATSDNMCEVVENFAEVCAAFRECSLWGQMLEDPKNNCSCSNYQYESLGGDGVNPLCKGYYLPNAEYTCPY